MKKLLMAVAAFGMLLTSCAKDDTAQVDSVVTFTVNTPDVATRAYGEGKEATTLYWAVYDQNGIVEQLTGSKSINLTTTVDLKLIQGRTYDVLFWAANASMENVYKVDFTTKSMEIDYAALEANQESYDAFFKYENIGTVNGAMSRTVELRRPFAQLNIGTADTEDAKKAEFEIQQTAVTVKQVFTKLDLATGTASDEQDVTFALANKAEGTIAANGKSYDHIAMNYLLVNGKKLINVDLTLNNGTSSLTRSYTSVPVERNFRTNIVGNIITAPAEFKVVILPGFAVDEHPFTPEDKLAMAAQAGGEYTLEEDMELSSALVVSSAFTLNLNGKTLKTAAERGYIVEVTEGGSANIKNGKLEVISTNGDVDGTGASTGGSSAVYCDGGNVKMEDVEIIGSQRGGHRAVQVFDGVGDFTNVKIDVNYGSGFNAGSGATVTLKNCEVTVNGMYKAPYNSVCFSVMGGGKLIVESGTYKIINDDVYPTGKSHGGWLGIVMNSGGTMDINGGTFTNVPADLAALSYERSMFSIDATAGLSATLNLNGGTFTPQHNKMVEKGGSGSYDVFAYVDGKLIEGFYVNDGVLAAMHDMGNGSWMVVHDLDKFDAVATNSSELSAAIANGDSNVILADDVTYSSAINNDANINLNGNTFEPTTTLELKNNSDLTMVGGNYEVNGTYGHIDVRPSTTEGSVVVFEDVDFSFNKLGPTYGTCTDRLGSVVEVCPTVDGAKAVVKFKNCTFDNASVLFEGMSGKRGQFEAVFEGCTFNALTSSSPIEVMNYMDGTITVKDCIFNLTCTSSSATAVAVNMASSAVQITATNNTLNAVAATPYTFDASKGETEVDNIKVFGTPKNIKLIYINGTASSATETGTTKTGIAQ
ncbi:MAG: hypothetical protein J6L75_05785 [Alistipes sp.]|nr:hypothetical protein [Alistipes sp.]